MDKLVLYIIGVFFLIGGIDYVLGNPLRLGAKFEEGIKTMGPLALGMVGIYSIAPLLSKVLSISIIPICRLFNLDPSIIPAAILATDMGGFNIATKIAFSKQMGLFSGVVIASTVGTTISFTIPVALGIISKEDEKYFSKGVMIGIISLPIGCFAAGLWQKINLGVLLWNLVPIFAFAFILGIGLLKVPNVLLKIFNVFGKLVVGLSIIGLLIQGINVLFDVKIVNGLAPFSEVAVIVVKIGLVLAGAYPMLDVINRVFKSKFEKIGKKLGINSISVAGILGNLASNLVTFGVFSKMNPKGKVICTAFGVSGAFVFGGQFGFVSGVAPQMSTEFIIVKFTSGIISILLTLFIYEFENRVTKECKLKERRGINYGN